MEIVEAVLPLLAQRSVVPARPIFTAAADVGEDIGIALLDPEQSKRPGAVRLAGQIAGRLRDAEPAISVDQRRHRAGGPPLADEEVRHPRTVLRGREALLDLVSAGVEPRRQALHCRG